MVMSKSNISYLMKTLAPRKVLIRKDVSKMVLLADETIANKISSLEVDLEAAKKSEEYQQLIGKTEKSAFLKPITNQLRSEKSRAKWFKPLKSSAIADNKTIDLLYRMFKAHELNFMELFADLYTLEKVNQVLLGQTLYTPLDANTNCCAFLEFLVSKKGKNFTHFEFLTFYNNLKMARQDEYKKKGFKFKELFRDTTYTQTQKVFHMWEKLGLGRCLGSPSSKLTPCQFEIKWDSTLLAHIAKSESMASLRTLIVTHSTKTQ